MSDWLPMSEAPKDRTAVLLRLRDDLVEAFDPTRSSVGGAWDLSVWAGIQFVGFNGKGDGDFDPGWAFAASVGQGGFPDKWFVGWCPLDPPGDWIKRRFEEMRSDKDIADNG